MAGCVFEGRVSRHECDRHQFLPYIALLSEQELLVPATANISGSCAFATTAKQLHTHVHTGYMVIMAPRKFLSSGIYVDPNATLHSPPEMPFAPAHWLSVPATLHQADVCRLQYTLYSE